MVTTKRSSVISLTLCVLGTSTSIPDCKMGAVIMKMMSRTRTTSTKGTMLISEKEVCVVLESCGMRKSQKFTVQSKLIKRFFDLGADLERKIVQALRQVANILQKVVVEDDRW